MSDMSPAATFSSASGPIRRDSSKTGDTQAEIAESPHKGSVVRFNLKHCRPVLTMAGARSSLQRGAQTAGRLSLLALGSAISKSEMRGLQLTGSYPYPRTVDLNIFDKRGSTGGPTQIIQGPTKSVTASTLIPSASTFYAGSYDGRIISGSIDTGVLENVNGDGHTNLVFGLTGAGGRAWSVGYDDKIREITANGFAPTSWSTNGQPKGVASTDDGTVFVVTTNGAEVYAGGNAGKKVAGLPLRTNPNCIAVHGKKVAIGAKDHKLYLYTWDGTSLQEIANFDKNRSAVTTVAFSSDDKWLAAGESSGKIMLFTDEGSGFQLKAALFQSRFHSHTARINALRFHPSNGWLVPGSLDTYIYVWNVVDGNPSEFPTRVWVG